MPKAAATTYGLMHIGIAVRDPERAVVERAVAAGGSTVTHRDQSTGRPYAMAPRA